MNKFIRIAGKARETVAQQKTVGTSPTVIPNNGAAIGATQANPLAPPTATAPNLGTSNPSTSPVTTAPKQTVNYFQLANIDPNQYTGTADQNERLRQVLDSQNNTKSRTFYDAYIARFKKWHQHPSQRINNLSGGVVPNKQAQPGQGQAQPGQGQAQPGQGQPGQSGAIPPPPPGFTRSQSGILIPPLPRE